MKRNVKLLSLMTVVVSLVASCVNDGLQEPQDADALKSLPALEEQVAAVEASQKDIKDLQTVFKSNDAEFGEAAEKAIEQYKEVVKGASLEEGTLATFSLQKQLASIVGGAIASVDFETYQTELKDALDAFGKGVSMWIGENFDALYPAALAQTRAEMTLAGFEGQLNKQQLYVGALLSDVQAGLRTDENPDELVSLAADLSQTVATSEKLNSELAGLSAEVEKEYGTAVKSILSDPAGFDAEALKQFNANAVVALASVDNSLSGLISRVEACEAQLQTILNRLGVLEEDLQEVKDQLAKDQEEIDALLAMIQSVTFMSEYSDGSAVAYYTLNTSATREDGKMKRTPASTISLSYLVRPASAAAALSKDNVKVLGYYAGRIQQQAAVTTTEYAVNSVAANSLGVVTVTVENELSEEFYFKETGAKMALSVQTGKTDLTTAFVEVVPKDQSSTVYVENLSLSSSTLEVPQGETKRISAIVSPSDATESGVTWTTSNFEVLTIAEDGTITANKVGTAVVTATTKGIDEWGQTMTASCTVSVVPSVKLVGPTYVPVGGTIDIKVEGSEYISPSEVTWSFENEEAINTASYVSLEASTTEAKVTVTGTGMYYSDKAYKAVNIICTYGTTSPVELVYPIRVVAVQPTGVSISGIADDATSYTLKVGTTLELDNSTVLPEGINKDKDYFYLNYLSGNSSVVSIDNYYKTLTAAAPGSAYVDFIVGSDGYFYPTGKDFRRSVLFYVEPYYVTSVTLPETLTMAPEDAATLTAEFTSDVDGVQPTYKDLTWVSSDPTKVSVDSETGKVTALAVGTVIITATTSHSNAVPSGSPQKSASCIVTVEEPVAEIRVGDYYYSDGTWGSDANPSGKTVIGVIFSKSNAVVSDPILRRDYSDCTHGLVLGLVEYTSQFGYFREQGYYYNSIYDATDGYGISSYGAVLTEDDDATGYGLTLAYGNYREKTKSLSGYADACILFDSTSGVAATHNSSCQSPASAWYIPSKFEMNEIYNNKSVINSSLDAVGGTIVSDAYYWSSYIYNKKINEDSLYHDCYAYPIDMSNGQWISGLSKTTSYSVRVVLAF